MAGLVPKEAQKRYQATFDKRHPGRRAEIRRAYKQRIRDWLDDIRLHAVCEWCGNPAGLGRTGITFHHRDPETKLFSIGLADRGRQAILDEIAKCDIICSHCHRVHHVAQREFEDDGKFKAVA